MSTQTKMFSGADENFIARSRKIKQLIEKNPGYTCSEIATLLEVTESQIVDDMKRLYKDVRDSSDKREDIYKRMIALINRFPEISYNKGAKECGMHTTTWKQRAIRLTQDEKIPAEYMTRKHPPVTSELNTDIDDSDLTAYTQKKFTDFLSQVGDSEEIELLPDDLVGTDEIMQRLWLTVVKSVLSNKLRPKTFNEAKQLLVLMMQYMDVMNERRRREEESDVFRPYKDTEDDEIFTWIDDALTVFAYIRSGDHHDRELVEHIRQQLTDVVHNEEEDSGTVSDV